MARFRVSVYAGPQHKPQTTLLSIAALLGTNIRSLQSGLAQRGSSDMVHIEFATMQESIVEGIRKLDGVQIVRTI